MFAETPSSRPPELPFKDSPFSIRGRFNRMSYLGGYGLIYLVTLIGYFILASFLGSFQLSKPIFFLTLTLVEGVKYSQDEVK